MLERYSQDREGFRFALSFYYSKPRSANSWDGSWGEIDKESGRRNAYSVRYSTDYLMTSERWPTDIRLNVNWDSHAGSTRGIHTTVGYFLKEENLEQARIIREHEEDVSAVLRGWLEKIETVTKSQRHDGSPGARTYTAEGEFRQGFFDLATEVTVYTIRPKELIVHAGGQRYRWQFESRAPQVSAAPQRRAPEERVLFQTKLSPRVFVTNRSVERQASFTWTDRNISHTLIAKVITGRKQGYNDTS